MTLVRFPHRPNGFTSFNNLLSDVFPQVPSLYKEDPRQVAPVNIKETEKEYLLDIIAPGMNKEDFSINIENNQLTISAEKKDETVNENEKQIRKEFTFQSFKRSFTLDEKISADNISAQYVNGVLTLNLPKKEEVKPATKQITIN
jgi:HSP20 family protein